ncbi:hypothetical protein LINPERHAP2_LOCUS1186 [Linum perenne]
MMVIVGRLLENYNFQQPELQSEDEAILELEKLMRKIEPQSVLLESFKSSAASSFEAQESFESKSDATDKENEVKECSMDQGSFPHLASNTQDASPSDMKIGLHKSDKGNDELQQDIVRGLAILRNNMVSIDQGNDLATGSIDQGKDLAMKVAGTNCPNPEIMPIAV